MSLSTLEDTIPAADTDTARIVLTAPVNLRDLGGITIANPAGTGVLAQGLAIRADDLSLVTAEVADSLVAQGLSAVIDLRSHAEAEMTGRGPLAARPVSYHHLPLMADIGSSIQRDTPLTHHAMGEMYIGMYESAAAQLVTALNIIAYTQGTAAFHCTAGRDRTGVLAASLLMSLGANDADIVTDYAKTGENMPAIMARTAGVMAPLMKRLGFDHSQMRAGSLIEGGMEVSMERLLSYLRSTYGDPLAPLRSAGLSDTTILRLQERAATVRGSSQDRA
ncbi:tyrosine-protein phosphatase [Leucobacter sp. cx-328]|uniref:tyrosine-protein phosphatase n=1 Tax=unclassified Leucobacter TaxID=2621730 RepID=UPI00165D417B|nr:MULTISPECIES: tyrosine-protein phosphatase [unclassified Leucobacter]MBC9942930.1 tyrosine-protein phosphatase [Leucobacter sp. cx-328]